MAHPGNLAPCGPRPNCGGSRSRLSTRGAVYRLTGVWRCPGAHQSTPAARREKPMWARDRRRRTLNSNHLLPCRFSLVRHMHYCIAWSRSQARINGKGCARKGIRLEIFAPNPMNMADTNLDPARASPSSDAQEHRRTLAKKNGLDCRSRIKSGYS